MISSAESRNAFASQYFEVPASYLISTAQVFTNVNAFETALVNCGPPFSKYRAFSQS